MSRLAIQILATIFAALPISQAHAGRCSQDIHDTMIAVANRLGTVALQVQSSRETRYATMHRQPTPTTVAQAEAQLGAMSANAAKAFDESIERAGAADSLDDLQACRTALRDARRALVQPR